MSFQHYIFNGSQPSCLAASVSSAGIQLGSGLRSLSVCLQALLPSSRAVTSIPPSGHRQAAKKCWESALPGYSLPTPPGWNTDMFQSYSKPGFYPKSRQAPSLQETEAWCAPAAHDAPPWAEVIALDSAEQSHAKDKWELGRAEVTRQAKEQCRNSSLAFASLNHFLCSALCLWADREATACRQAAGRWTQDPLQGSLTPPWASSEPILAWLCSVSESCALRVPLWVSDKAAAALASTALPCLTLWTQNVPSQTSALRGGHTGSRAPTERLPASLGSCLCCS